MVRHSRHAERVREEGPLSSDEIDFSLLTGTTCINQGLRKFDINTTANGTTPRFPDTAAVVYSPDDHTPTEVLSKWLAANRERIETHRRPVYYESVSRGISPEFQDAWEELRPLIDWLETPDRDRSNSGTGVYEGGCPYCGDPDVKDLPSHLPGCPET